MRRPTVPILLTLLVLLAGASCGDSDDLEPYETRGDDNEDTTVPEEAP